MNFPQINLGRFGTSSFMTISSWVSNWHCLYLWCGWAQAMRFERYVIDPYTDGKGVNEEQRNDVYADYGCYQWECDHSGDEQWKPSQERQNAGQKAVVAAPDGYHHWENAKTRTDEFADHCTRVSVRGTGDGSKDWLSDTDGLEWWSCECWPTGASECRVGAESEGNRRKSLRRIPTLLRSSASKPSLPVLQVWANDTYKCVRQRSVTHLSVWYRHSIHQLIVKPNYLYRQYFLMTSPGLGSANYPNTIFFQINLIF